MTTITANYRNQLAMKLLAAKGLDPEFVEALANVDPEQTMLVVKPESMRIRYLNKTGNGCACGCKAEEIEIGFPSGTVVLTSLNGCNLTVVKYGPTDLDEINEEYGRILVEIQRVYRTRRSHTPTASQI